MLKIFWIKEVIFNKSRLNNWFRLIRTIEFWQSGELFLQSGHFFPISFKLSEFRVFGERLSHHVHNIKFLWIKFIKDDCIGNTIFTLQLLTFMVNYLSHCNFFGQLIRITHKNYNITFFIYSSSSCPTTHLSILTWV